MYWRFAMTLLLSAFAFVANAQESDRRTAPFGLTWGMTTSQAKEAGIELRDSPLKEFGASYAASKVPKVLSDVNLIALSFGYDDRLWRVAAVSRSFENDPSGSHVLARYGELVSLLSDKYGKGRNVHQSNKNYTGGDFVMGVSTGRNHWFTNYDDGIVAVQIGIGASGLSTTYWRLIFEHKNLRSNFEKGRRTEEKGAL